MYSYVAHGISEKYEQWLSHSSLHPCILAYRKLGDCNVGFAYNVFTHIKERGNCCVLTFDIEKFFDSLDHGLLKESWLEAIQQEHLSALDYQVYKSLTKFSYVLKEDIYQHFPPKNNQVRLCSPFELRTVIAQQELIHKHKESYGIPQGTPMSALLSNLYLKNFDIEVGTLAQELNATYKRYSDDILIICSEDQVEQFKICVEKSLTHYKLKLNNDKTETVEFHTNDAFLNASKPLQYLGFTFDGRSILLRSQTLSRYHQKVSAAVKSVKHVYTKYYKRKRFPRKKLYRVYSHLGKRNFIRYALRAAEKMQSEATGKSCISILIPYNSARALLLISLCQGIQNTLKRLGSGSRLNARFTTTYPTHMDFSRSFVLSKFVGMSDQHARSTHTSSQKGF